MEERVEEKKVRGPRTRKRRVRLTPVSTLHYVRLVYRSVLFILLLVGYISFRLFDGRDITERLENQPAIIVVTCAVFIFEMILRFFPSKLESPGCQKQFASNYIRSGETDIVIEDNNAVFLVALIWISFNGIFGALHMAGSSTTALCSFCAARTPCAT